MIFFFFNFNGGATGLSPPLGCVVQIVQNFKGLRFLAIGM